MTTAHAHHSRQGHRRTFAVALVLVAVASVGCRGGDVLAPPTEPSAPTPNYTVSGQLVDVLTGAPVAGTSLRVNRTAAVSDADGRFEMAVPGTSKYVLTTSSADFVPRETYVEVNRPSQVISLIPSSFNLVVLDATLRPAGTGVARWLSTPSLVVLTREVQYAGYGDAAEVLENELDAPTLAGLVADLTDGYMTLTDGRLGNFTSVTLESPTPGTRVQLKRRGAIVVARAKDLADLGGYGGAAWRAAEGQVIVGAVILLERWTDSLKNHQYPGHARRHEMGHAVGYYHAPCCSVMNTSDLSYSGLTDWDRQAARIVYQRPPGNQSPDTDPESMYRPANAALQWFLADK